MEVSQQNISAAKSREKVRLIICPRFGWIASSSLLDLDQTFNWWRGSQLFLSRLSECRMDWREAGTAGAPAPTFAAVRVQREQYGERAKRLQPTRFHWKTDAACKSYASAGGWKFPETAACSPTRVLGCGPPSSAASWRQRQRWRGRVKKSLHPSIKSNAPLIQFLPKCWSQLVPAAAWLEGWKRLSEDPFFHQSWAI